jgi:hypothetical protein
MAQNTSKKVSVANQQQLHTLTTELTKVKVVTPAQIIHNTKATNFTPETNSLGVCLNHHSSCPD